MSTTPTPNDPFWNDTTLFPAAYAGTIPVPLSVSDWSGGEWAAIVIGSISNGFTFGLLLWILYDRKYRPLKAIQPDLFAVIILAGYAYWLTNNSQLRLIPQVGAFTGAGCTVWGIWIQFVFGLSLFLVVICFRFLRLFRIVYQRKAANSWKFQSLLFLLWSPSWILAIIGSSIQGNGPVMTRGLYFCSFNQNFYLFYLLYYALLIILFATLAVLLSRVRAKIFNEYYEHLILFGVYAIAFVVFTYVDFTNHQFTSWARTLVSFVTLIAINTYFFVIAGRPLYWSLFRREYGLARFNALISGKIIFSSEFHPSVLSGKTSTDKITISDKNSDKNSKSQLNLSDLESSVAPKEPEHE